MRFPELSHAKAKNLVKLSKDAREEYNRRAAFYAGDHWQDGAGWIGEMPQIVPGEDGKENERQRQKIQQVSDRIRNNFVSQNAIKDIVDRHATGLCGRPVRVDWLTPTSAEQEEGEGEESEDGTADAEPDAYEQERARLMANWRRENDAGGVLLRAMQKALTGGESTLRIFIPKGRLEEYAPDTPGEDGGADTGSEEVPRPEDLDLAEALELIHVEALDRSRATVYTDRDSMRDVGLFDYRVKDSEGGDQGRIEVSYVDTGGEEQRTKIKLLRGGGSAEDAEFPGFQLGGRLMHHAVRVDSMVTPQVVQQQKALNKGHTYKSSNLDWTGFGERTILNGEPPGRYVDDPKAPDGERFVPEPYITGPGTTNFVGGIKTERQRGSGPNARTEEVVATPSIDYRTPEKSELFNDSINGARRAILDEASQQHALLNLGIDVSGEALRQHRADYIVSLLLNKGEAESAAKWLEETVWFLANDLAGQAITQDTEGAEDRVQARAQLSTGPVPASEIEAIVSLVESYIMSRSTARAEVGIDDVEAELQEIHADLYMQAKQELDGRAALVDKLVNSVGLTVEDAMRRAGYSQDEIDETVSYDRDNPPEQ